MKYTKISDTNLTVPNIAVGCMRMTELDPNGAKRFVNSMLEMGFNFFDHADIYGNGACEEMFAKAVNMNSNVREKLIIQSKCGIRPGVAYDFSTDYIISAVECSLKRLNTDYLDILLLHRPDALCEPAEVAEAFNILHSQGKVKHFGVSNHTPLQIKLLEKETDFKLVVNQMQFGIGHSTMVSAGIHANMTDNLAINRDGGVLDYCRLNNITIQAWSPFQYGFFNGIIFDREKFPHLNNVLDEIANKYGVSNTAVAVAWILRHPANIIPVTGTMNVDRMKDISKANDFILTRDEWYKIYIAAGNTLP